MFHNICQQFVSNANLGLGDKKRLMNYYDNYLIHGK